MLRHVVTDLMEKGDLEEIVSLASLRVDLTGDIAFDVAFDLPPSVIRGRYG